VKVTIQIPLAAFLLVGCTSFAQNDSREWMARGIDEFRHEHIPEAVRCFEQATKLDPTSADAWVSLAVAYQGILVLGVEENPSAHRVEESLLRALEIDPRNKFALGFLAALYYARAQATPSLPEKMAKLSDVEGLQRRIVGVDPNDKEAHYMLGVIAWVRTYIQIATRLAGTGMKAEGRSPLPDSGARQQLRASVGPQIDEGIKQSSRALEIDVNYADAMSYLSYFLREKAALSDRRREASRYVTTADEWDAKATKIRKRQRNDWLAGRTKVAEDPQGYPWPPSPWVMPPAPPPQIR
jgi:tetratricopeptide (TPR) repeat protein